MTPSAEQLPSTKKTAAPKRAELQRNPTEKIPGSEPAARMLAAFQAFAEEYGTTGASLLTERLKERGTLNAQDIQKITHEVPPIKEFRKDSFEALEFSGAIQRKGAQIIADLDAVKKLSFSDLGKAFNEKQLKKYQAYLNRPFVEVMAELFRDVEVISTKDAKEQKQPATHPLFYIPQGPEEALDPEAIRNNKAYLGLWELGRGSTNRWKAPYYPGAGTDTNFQEASLAALIYHPEYGRGYRTPDGTLMVYDPKKETHIPITKDWFTKIMRFQSGNVSRGETTMHTPREFLEQNAPNVEKHGLLTRTDFRQMSTTAQKEHASGRVERVGVSNSGEVMLYGVLHYLGRQFGGENRKKIRIHELGPNLGGIAIEDADGTEHLTHTFQLLHPDNPGLTQVRYGDGKMRGRAGADLTQVTPIEQLHERADGEKTDAFQTRIQQAERFQSFLAVSKKLWKDTGVRLAELPPNTQGWITDAIEHVGPERQSALSQFGKTYGIEGVKTFLSARLEQPAEATGRILDLAKRLGEPLMRSVINRYTEILSLTEKTAAELGREVFGTTGNAPSLDTRALQKELLRRASSVLIDASKTAEAPDITAEEILARLNQHEKDLALFASVFKTAFKGKPDVRFEDLRGVELQARARTKLDEETQKEMLAIAYANWKQDPLLRDLPVQALKKKLQGTEDDSLFYLLRKQGKPLAFMRFDERPDGSLYAGSLNVDPALRGSAIGEAFLNASLDSAGKEKAIHADFFPQVDAGMMYVDRFGWVVTGTETIKTPEGKKATRCTMVRDPHWTEQLKSRKENISKEYLQAHAGDSHAPFQIERFHFPQDQQRFTSTVARAAQEGRVMSRYFAETPDGRSRIAVFEPKPHT